LDALNVADLLDFAVSFHGIVYGHIDVACLSEAAHKATLLPDWGGEAVGNLAICARWIRL